MVGLGIVEPRTPFPYGAVSSGSKLSLTGQGERLYQSLQKIPGTFPEGSGPSEIRAIRRALERRPGVYAEASGILLDSPALTNFQIFLASRPDSEIRHDDAFYREYGRKFGIEDAAFNRVPSVLQMAQLCGVAPLSGTDSPSDVRIRYSGPRRPGPRGLKRRAKLAGAAGTDEEEETLDELVDDLGADAPARAKALVTVVKRNVKLAERLKRMYKGRCQICGSTFKKRDGRNYSESHHVVPLGRRGADRLSNIVVLCATCHRKLHYADVRHLPPVGGRTLVIINGETVEINYSISHRQLLSSR